MPQAGSDRSLVQYSPQQAASLAEALGACLAVQRTYGKQAGDLKAIAKVFLAALAEFEPDAVIDAIAQWLTKSPEFPTPFDIRQLLANDDEPRREIYQRIVATMRAGQSLQRWEWDYLKRYEDANR